MDVGCERQHDASVCRESPGKMAGIIRWLPEFPASANAGRRPHSVTACCSKAEQQAGEPAALPAW